jgi:hypothetical protein
MKTNKHWYPYEESGSYFKLEDGKLLESPINITEQLPKDIYVVPWNWGVVGENLPHLQKIVKELQEKE